LILKFASSAACAVAPAFFSTIILSGTASILSRPALFTNFLIGKRQRLPIFRQVRPTPAELRRTAACERAADWYESGG
jgi:hypothetical protein